MNQRRIVRLFTLVLLATSLAACHFHGHGFGRHHCHVPVRHCR